MSCVTPDAERRLVALFRHAAEAVPAYASLIREQNVVVNEVVDAASFSRRAPILSKANTFDRFTLDELSVGGVLPELADVLTSSGHGGRFSFGLSTRTEAQASAQMLDRAFDAAFEVASRRTLAINCLPMGVTFSSRCMTVATTSVREDMVVALVKAFADRYEQLLLVGDPLFLKRLMDYSQEAGLDWSKYRVNVIIGEETFGEHFRSYLAQSLGLDPDRLAGHIISSFGVGELGLHLCYETSATIALRRSAYDNLPFARELFGGSVAEMQVMPMIFTFDPLRTFIEVNNAGSERFGRMTTSMLEPHRTIPLLRYQTGDVIRLIDRANVIDCAKRNGVVLPDLPESLVALRGRERDVLPTGSCVGIFKDALYADRQAAAQFTGAVRLICKNARCTAHVQLVPGAEPSPALEARLLAAVPQQSRPDRFVLWPYDRFPFGMRLDYERKFNYFVAGETLPDTERRRKRS